MAMLVSLKRTFQRYSFLGQRPIIIWAFVSHPATLPFRKTVSGDSGCPLCSDEAVCTRGVLGHEGGGWGCAVASALWTFTKLPQDSCLSVDWGGWLLWGIHGPMGLAWQPNALLGDGGGDWSASLGRGLLGALWSGCDLCPLGPLRERWIPDFSAWSCPSLSW